MFYLGDSTKVGLLKGLPGAETNLKLFEADIYRPDEFVPALHGCQVVLHLDTPLLPNQQSSKAQHFLEKLSEEVSLHLQGCGVKGRTFTLKIKKRKVDALGSQQNIWAMESMTTRATLQRCQWLQMRLMCFVRLLLSSLGVSK